MAKETQKQTIARLSVENWNLEHPVGSKVDVRLDSGEVKHTTTRSEAYVSHSGHAVIFLVGVSGYYLLDRVSAEGE